MYWFSPSNWEYGVDNVFQHFRTSQTAFFRDVTNQNNWYIVFFGVFQDTIGAFADLSNRAGRRFNRFGRNRLDGVDNKQIGSNLFALR